MRGAALIDFCHTRNTLAYCAKQPQKGLYNSWYRSGSEIIFLTPPPFNKNHPSQTKNSSYVINVIKHFWHYLHFGIIYAWV